MYVLESMKVYILHVLFLRSDKTTVEARSSAIIGNDGAYSLIRREMSKQPWLVFVLRYLNECSCLIDLSEITSNPFPFRYNYKQEYIAHAYQELTIPSRDGQV